MFKVNHTHRNQGFTLIELLVVIAIIGILSGIVLTSLSGARSKAEDARVKQNLSGYRTAAELYYIEFGAYQGTFNGVAHNVCNYADITGPYYDELPGVSCRKNYKSYAVSAQLTSGSYFCVDSSGFLGEISSSVVAGDAPTAESVRCQ